MAQTIDIEKVGDSVVVTIPLTDQQEGKALTLALDADDAYQLGRELMTLATLPGSTLDDPAGVPSEG